MVNGKEMAAVAADGYTGTKESTIGSSGYTSLDAIANAAMSSGNSGNSSNSNSSDETNVGAASTTSFGNNSLITGEATGNSNQVFDDATNGSNPFGDNSGSVNTSAKDDDLSVGSGTISQASSSNDNSSIGSSGYISLDAIAANNTSNNSSNNSSDETAVDQMGAVNIENAISSGGSGSLVSGVASDENQAAFASINANAGGADNGETEFSDEKASSDVLALSEETGMSVASINAIAALEAYDLVDGQLILVRDPTRVWDGDKLVDNPNYSNEVNQNETMTGNVGTGFGSSDLSGGSSGSGSSSQSTYDEAYEALTNEQKMLVESGQATLSSDGTFTDLRNGGTSTIDANSGEVEVVTGGASNITGIPFEDMTTGLVYDQEGGNLLNGTYNGLEYVDGVPVVTDDGTDNTDALNNAVESAVGPSFDMTDGEELLKNSDGSLFTGEYNGKQYVNGVEVSSTNENVNENVTVNENDGYMYYDGYLFKDGVAFSGDYGGATYVDGVVVTDSGENAQTAYDIAYAALTNEQKMLIESGQATLDSDGVFTDLRVGGNENTEGGNENTEGGGEATGPLLQDGFMVNADGSLFTGTANGVEYVDGVPVVTGGGENTEGGDEGATGPTLDANGVLVNADGSLFNGTFEGKTYKDGLEVNEGGGEESTGPSFNATGQLVNADGTLFTGSFGGKQYINGVEQNDDDNSSNTGPTMNADGLLANADGTLFTGTFGGKEYVDGVEVTQENNETTAGNQTLTVQYPDGTIVNATVDADGNVFDADGNQIGTWDGTTFTRSDGTSIEGSLQSVTINMNDGSTLTGYIDGSNVLDADGNIIGTINDQGQFVPAGSSGGTVDETGTGEVDTGYTVSNGIIYDSDGNIIGYEDGYQSDTDTLAGNLESVTGNSTAGLSRAEIIALIEEYMSSYNSADYDPAAFMNAFGFALDPNFSGAVIPSFMQSDTGVYMRRMVKDRDTGEMRYIDVPIGGAFSTTTDSQRMQRRQGFGQSINF